MGGIEGEAGIGAGIGEGGIGRDDCLTVHTVMLMTCNTIVFSVTTQILL